MSKPSALRSIGCGAEPPAAQKLSTYTWISVHANADTLITASKEDSKTRVTVRDPKGGVVVDMYLPNDEIIRLAQAIKDVQQ